MRIAYIRIAKRERN